jgi:hypothetical protein
MVQRPLALVLAALILSGVSVARGAAVAPKPAAAPPAPAAAAEAQEAPKKKAPCPVMRYLRNRGRDFADIFNMKLALADGSSVLFHARATRLLQIGAGRFCGTKMGFDGPCSGVYGEGRVEYGFSVFYWSWIGRKWTEAGVSEEAVKRNWFFGHVDDITADGTYIEFYDGHRPWYTIGASFALPFLPGMEMEINPAEAVDFVLSLPGVPGLRVPPPFKKEDKAGERIPITGCIRWHGQEEFESYE